MKKLHALQMPSKLFPAYVVCGQFLSLRASTLAGVGDARIAHRHGQSHLSEERSEGVRDAEFGDRSVVLDEQQVAAQTGG